MPRVFVVRHGATTLNDPNNERFRAWSNPSLNDEGIREAKARGAELAKFPIYLIVTSDLFRAYNTADIIAKYTGGKVQPTKALRPWDLGDLTGEPVNSQNVKKLDYFSQHPDVPIPGGESFSSFAFRFGAMLEKTLEYARTHPDQTVVMVTHHRNCRALVAYLDGKPMTELSFETGGPAPGHMFELVLVKDKWKIKGMTNGNSDASD